MARPILLHKPWLIISMIQTEKQHVMFSRADNGFHQGLSSRNLGPTLEPGFVMVTYSPRVLCIHWHSIVLRVGVNKLVKYVCAVGAALSLTITAGHVTEKFVWLKGCSYMKNLRTGEAEREAIWDKVDLL